MARDEKRRLEKRSTSNNEILKRCGSIIVGGSGLGGGGSHAHRGIRNLPESYHIL